MAKMTEVVCDQCHGSTKDSSGNACEYCNGTGLKTGQILVTK